jgi:hypothetical protein
MKITVCGSTAFIDELEKLALALGTLGHEVKLPPSIITTADGNSVHTREYYQIKKSFPHDPAFWHDHTNRIKDHFEKVQWSEAVLIADYDKNGIAGYIGGNTLMEMGLAFHLGKKIFLLRPVPEIAYREEILGLRPIILNGRLEEIR